MKIGCKRKKKLGRVFEHEGGGEGREFVQQRKGSAPSSVEAPRPVIGKRGSKEVHLPTDKGTGEEKAGRRRDHFGQKEKKGAGIDLGRWGARG